MMRRGLGFALLFASVPAAAAPIELPRSYAGCPVGPNDPTHIAIVESAQGVKVIYQRRGRDAGPFETLDVNLAKISRRLFFTLRTPRGLVEFQGRATDDELIGLLSDETGLARPVSLPASRDGIHESCVPVPDPHV